VTLHWQAPANTVVTQYLVEAGSSPGAADLARILTGTTTPSLIAQAVPDGIYYVRIRAVGDNGVGTPSSEASFAVGGPSSPCAASAPSNLAVVVAGHAVQLTWSASPGPCSPTHYVVLAGSAPGLSDRAQVLASNAVFAAAAPAGTYYVRVVAVTASGASAPSNEVVVTVRP
jgi:hypothetical protein